MFSKRSELTQVALEGPLVLAVLAKVCGDGDIVVAKKLKE